MRQTRPTAAPAPSAQAGQVRPANMNARPITGQSTAQPRAGMAMPQTTGIPGRAPQQAQAPGMAQPARPGYPGYPKPMPAQVGDLTLSLIEKRDFFMTAPSFKFTTGHILRCLRSLSELCQSFKHCPFSPSVSGMITQFLKAHKLKWH